MCVVALFLTVYRIKDAYVYASTLDTPDTWSELALVALKHFDIDTGRNSVYMYMRNVMYILHVHMYVTIIPFLAIRAYRHLEDIAMVMALQKIQVVCVTTY